MPLLDRWLRRATGPTPLIQADFPTYTSSPLRVLRADGQRIDLTARDAGTRLTLIRQEWQTDAWTYRDMIGELRYAQRLLARSVSTVRFYAAEIRDYPNEPEELTGTAHTLDSQLAKDAVDNLARLPLDDGPDGFIATFTENIETAGECWIHGEPDEDGLGERWSIRSISEIIGAGDQVFLAELPTISTVGQRLIDPANEELLRCWTRHPRWGQLADSPLRAMLDVLEEVVLTGREQRAAARSRIASNGVLLVPNSLALLRTREDDEDLLEQGVLENEFMADFTEALTAPIRNEGDAGAVVPLILRGDPDALKEVRHLSLTRDDAAKLMDRLQGAVLRMLQGLDIQPEQVQGIGATNHWGGWLIEASNIRHQVLPTCGIVAGCFTKAFLRPALLALGHSPEQVRRVAVWYDPTGLVESPDRSQDARDAWDRDTISNEALREALGFDDEDAPEAHEHLVRLLSRGRLTPQAVPLVAALSGVDLRDPGIQQALAIAVGLNAPGPRVVAGQGKTTTPALPAGEPQATANPAQANQVVPEQPAPAAPTGNGSTSAGVVASAAPPSGWRVDVATARALTEIDASLTERILIAGDAAIVRAVERAGGRARNAVRGDKALAASLAGADAVLVPMTLGRETLGSFVSVADLLAGAYQRVGDQVTKWLADAARSVADVTVRLLGLNPRGPEARTTRDTVMTRLEVHRPAAQAALNEALDAAAERALFRTDPLTVDVPNRGEVTDSLIAPADVMRALTIAGGGAPDQPGTTGFGTGLVVQNALTENGGVILGWEWNYRPQVARGSHFPPHQLLDGTRFSTWTDPKLDTDLATDWLGASFRPGDHPGCRCASVMIPAFIENDSNDIVGQRIREAAQSGHGRTATDVAANDTAAGWVGTSAQNEVETRDRILAGVEALRAHYIEGAQV